ncbi:MAG: hypothetical protein ABFS41_03175 [Myxococcota bacterium]
MASASAKPKAKQGLGSAKDIKTLATERTNAPNPDPQLDPGDLQHFIDHWLTPQGGGSKEFAHIPPEVVSAVLKEGFRQAVAKSEAAEYGGSDKKPLPISAAWICNADPHVFEVVVIPRKDVHVQVLLVTPPPAEHGETTHPADNVFVTRYFQTVGDINDVKFRLWKLGSPNYDEPKNPQDQPAQPQQVGTFQIYT